MRFLLALALFLPGCMTPSTPEYAEYAYEVRMIGQDLEGVASHLEYIGKPEKAEVVRTVAGHIRTIADILEGGQGSVDAQFQLAEEATLLLPEDWRLEAQLALMVVRAALNRAND
jgi:hypothetical protein